MKLKMQKVGRMKNIKGIPPFMNDGVLDIKGWPPGIFKGGHRDGIKPGTWNFVIIGGTHG